MGQTCSCTDPSENTQELKVEHDDIVAKQKKYSQAGGMTHNAGNEDGFPHNQDSVTKILPNMNYEDAGEIMDKLVKDNTELQYR